MLTKWFGFEKSIHFSPLWVDIIKEAIVHVSVHLKTTSNWHIFIQLFEVIDFSIHQIFMKYEDGLQLQLHSLKHAPVVLCRTLNCPDRVRYLPNPNPTFFIIVNPKVQLFSSFWSISVNNASVKLKRYCLWCSFWQVFGMIKLVYVVAVNTLWLLNVIPRACWFGNSLYRNLNIPFLVFAKISPCVNLR